MTFYVRRDTGLAQATFGEFEGFLGTYRPYASQVPADIIGTDPLHDGTDANYISVSQVGPGTSWSAVQFVFPQLTPDATLDEICLRLRVRGTAGMEQGTIRFYDGSAAPTAPPVYELGFYSSAGTAWSYSELLINSSTNPGFYAAVFAALTSSGGLVVKICGHSINVAYLDVSEFWIVAHSASGVDTAIASGPMTEDFSAGVDGAALVYSNLDTGYVSYPEVAGGAPGWIPFYGGSQYSPEFAGLANAGVTGGDWRFSTTKAHSGSVSAHRNGGGLDFLTLDRPTDTLNYGSVWINRDGAPAEAAALSYFTTSGFSAYAIVGVDATEQITFDDSGAGHLDSGVAWPAGWAQIEWLRAGSAVTGRVKDAAGTVLATYTTGSIGMDAAGTVLYALGYTTDYYADDMQLLAAAPVEPEGPPPLWRNLVINPSGEQGYNKAWGATNGTAMTNVTWEV